MESEECALFTVDMSRRYSQRTNGCHSVQFPKLNHTDPKLIGLQFIVYHCFLRKAPITHLVSGFTLIGNPGQKLCLLLNEVIS